MYSNFKNYSVTYHEKSHSFSCSYSSDGRAEERPFIQDATVSVCSYDGKSIHPSEYKKMEINPRAHLGGTELNVIYSEGPKSVPSFSLHFALDSTSLQVRTFARATIHVKGKILWGDDPEKSTFGVRLNAEDHHLRTACGPAFSIHDHALFDKLSDRVLEFKAPEKFKVRYDWSASSYHFDFESGLDFGRTFTFKIHEHYYKQKFNIPYAPINKSHGFETPPVGWMTWYATQFKTNEEIVIQNAKALASIFGKHSEKLCLWVDWEWNHKSFDGLGQKGVDTFTPRPEAYPSGLAHVAREIEKLGLIPALWIGATNDGQQNHLLKKHPDWILAQKPEWCGQWWIDPSHPGVIEEYIPTIFKQILGWGFQAIKWDCLPVTFDVCDRFHSKFHDPALSTDVVMRNLVKAARKAVSPKVYLLSCSGMTERDITFAMDIFNAARIGGDIFEWEDFISNSIERVLHFYPWHNVVAYADADNLVLRKEFNSLAQARSRVSFYGLAGLPVTIGDSLPDLDQARVEMLKKIIPVADIHPMDLQPKVKGSSYVLSNLAVCKKFGQWNVVNILNTKDIPLTLKISLEADLHLDTSNGRCHAIYSFWDNQFLGIHDDSLTIEVPPLDSVVLRITAVEPHPLVVSTSRHITQGAYDLESLDWKNKCLSGKSRLVEGESYRLSVYVPQGYQFSEALLPKQCDVQYSFNENSRLLSVNMITQSKSLMDWKLLFKVRKTR